MNRKRAPKAIVHQPVAQFYGRFVEGIKKRIRTAQIRAALAANAQLVLHYWEVGRDILASQKREGWGAKIIDRLANDLQQEFPKLSGYSARNLKYMFVAVQPDHRLKIDGFYRFLRHPSYLGALLVMTGWALVFRSVIGLLLTAAMCLPIIALIRAEEEFLVREFGEQYRSYQQTTRWRLFPLLY